jgi:putative ABC transport system permease protein
VRLLDRDWRVCGISEPGKLARIVIPRRTLQDLTSTTGKLSSVFLKLDNPANTDKAVAALKQRLPDYPIYSMEELTSLYSVNNVPGLKAFIGVIIGLSIVVGFLVVFLSMYTAVLERTREIGILKALGASPAYVLNVIFRETALLALVGSVLGILLTYGRGRRSRRWYRRRYPENRTGWWPIAGATDVQGDLGRIRREGRTTDAIEAPA